MNMISYISGTKLISLMQKVYLEEYNIQVSLLRHNCGEIKDHEN